MRSIVYQKQYQESLKKQVSGIIDKLHDEDYKTVSEYLEKCYDDGFIGTMYDLQGQGIPMCFPLDQESMVRAVQLDSKISKGLYSRLGEDVNVLKKKITAQVSRGISTAEARALTEDALTSGRALLKFKEWISAQGGNADAPLAKAKFTREIFAHSDSSLC